MRIGKVIYKRLSTDAAITALVGSRIYPNTAKQQAQMPYIVYTVIDVVPSPCHEESSRVDTTRMQVMVVSNVYEQAVDIHELVRARLDKMPHGLQEGLNIQGCEYDSTVDMYEDEDDAYNISSDYMIRENRP